MSKTHNKSNGITILVVVLLILIIVAASLILLKLKMDRDSQIAKASLQDNIEVEEPDPVPLTFLGNERPIAVMIDNHIDAMPQAGLSKAYIVYEMIVEGGETRLMEIFKSTEVNQIDLEKIGPIRSARHYFLDYALEHDAIYVHFGWSPQAQSDIPKLGVDNIHGIYESEKDFWRDKGKYAPHNAVTSTAVIKKLAEKKGYSLTSDKESVLNYTAEEVNLEGDSVKADTVTIPYSYNNTVKYEYDPETKNYIRYSRNKKQVDWLNNEEVRVKNIIITKCKNTTLNDGENKGRQTLSNIGTLDGYYITNGRAIEITCEKSARDAQTVYKDLEGNEIQVNDGNTFVQICPIDSKIAIEGEEEVIDANVVEGNTTTTQE